MRITSLTISDVPILRGIARDTFIETFSEANEAEDMDRYLAERFSEDQLARELSNPESFFYVAEVTSSSILHTHKPNHRRRTRSKLSVSTC